MKFYLAVLLTSAVISTIAENCTNLCRPTYIPACAKYPSCFMNFDDDCILRHINCWQKKTQKPEFNLVHWGDCKREETPVCPKDLIKALAENNATCHVCSRLTNSVYPKRSDT